MQILGEIASIGIAPLAILITAVFNARRVNDGSRGAYFRIAHHFQGMRRSSRMRFGSMAIVLSTLVGSASFANNVDLSGFQLNPGERVVAIDGVPVNSTPGRQAQGRQAGFQPVRSIASNIVGNLVRSNQPFSYTPGETALDKANYERRKNGVGDLIPDPELQQLALQKAQIAASRGYKNHIGGSLGGARAEGVGHTNGRFLSCCLDMPATYGGAAMVQGRDGWYCCLLVR